MRLAALLQLLMTLRRRFRANEAHFRFQRPLQHAVVREFARQHVLRGCQRLYFGAAEPELGSEKSLVLVSGPRISPSSAFTWGKRMAAPR